MKQNLTPEQVLSLSPEAQARLRDAVPPIVGCRYFDTRRETETYVAAVYTFEGKPGKMRGINGLLTYIKDYLPLLSIGQCLELLAEKVDADRLGIWLEVNTWVVTDFQRKGHNVLPPYDGCTEPINALFLAVKDVLEVGRE